MYPPDKYKTIIKYITADINDVREIEILEFWILEFNEILRVFFFFYYCYYYWLMPWLSLYSLNTLLYEDSLSTPS